MQSLLEISQEMEGLEEWLVEIGGDLGDGTSDTAKLILARLNEVFADLKGKADNYAALITCLEARAQSRRDESTRLAHRARVDDKSATFLRDRLKMVMEAHNIKKLETERFRISVAGNGGKAPLIIYDDTIIPARFMVPQPDAIDKDAIREAIDAGEEVSGAKLEQRGTSLRIK